MQVASLVRTTLALKNHRVASVSRRDGRIVVELDRVGRRWLPCSGCGTFDRVRDRLLERRWRHLPVWEIPVELRYRPARVACSGCGTPKVEVIPWSIGKSPLSRPLVVELAGWSRLLAWDVVARLYGVSWATVVSAVEQAVAYGLALRDLSGLRVIGVDELSRKRGHVYHTNVYDLGSSPRRLIWSGEGRSKATVERFFRDLGDEQAKRLEAVCCDMWANYVEVIQKRAPQAGLVFDKFHIVRHLLEAVNDVRKQEARALRREYPELLKGTRYIFLKNPENLTDRQRLRLAELEHHRGLKVLRAYELEGAVPPPVELPVQDVGEEALRPVVLVGDALGDRAHPGVRLDAPAPRVGRARLLRPPHRQRCGGGHEQQRQGHQPPRPRIPLGACLHVGDASLHGRPGASAKSPPDLMNPRHRAQILEKSLK